jgi:hypothetical protein
VGTVLGSAVVVVALIVGSVAGLTRILGEGEDDRDIGDGGYEVFQRTATIEAFTVGSPSDWYLVNQWPLSMLIAVEGTGGAPPSCPVDFPSCQGLSDETSSPIPVEHGLPMLQLSNVDLGLNSIACTESGIPSGAAALYVALYDTPIGGFGAPSIPPFPDEVGLPPQGDGPCGPGRYAQFTVNDHFFMAWIGIGSGVSDEDRETVENSYEMMSAIPEWELAPPDQTTPAYVIAGGTSEGGEVWRLELRPGEPNLELSLARSDAAAINMTLDDVLSDSSFARDLTDPIFGAVTKRASGVEFRPGTENVNYDLGGSPVRGTIVPVPQSLGSFDFDLFFIDPPAGFGELGGHVIALGVEMLSEEPPPVGEPRADEISLSGAYRGATWIVRFTGAFADGDACVHVTISSETSEPLCHRPSANAFAAEQPSADSWQTGALYLLVSSMPTEVADVQFVSDPGSGGLKEAQCTTGPSGWTDPDREVCVLVFPPRGSGAIEFLDADGALLFEHGMGWGIAEFEEPTPTPVDPLHGGTYWAVYPWLGPAGDPEANAVVGQLFDEFGIQAIQGEVGCDQGAAEALGTQAEWRVAVYFETEDEANAFASDAGLLGHEADPVIARVTTYCLD